METPPARGRDAAMLQTQLSSSSGQPIHRRRVSRTYGLEDTFFTPRSSPHAFPSTARFASPRQPGKGDDAAQFASPLAHNGATPRDWPAGAEGSDLPSKPPDQTGGAPESARQDPATTPLGSPQLISRTSARDFMHDMFPADAAVSRPTAQPPAAASYGAHSHMAASHGAHAHGTHAHSVGVPTASANHIHGTHAYESHSGGHTQGLGSHNHTYGSHMHAQSNRNHSHGHGSHSHGGHSHSQGYNQGSQTHGSHTQGSHTQGTHTQGTHYGHPHGHTLDPAQAPHYEKPQFERPPDHDKARALGSRRRCAKCDDDISGHFVRALGAAFHIDCFTCADCRVPCAAKFFPVDQQPLCEHCYFKRQNLLCYRCGNSLRGSYITALERKYHVEHFTCSLCTSVFGPEDSYFEYNGDVYCRSHYSALFAFHCEGCKSPILKQFVETYRGGKQQQWHPECYMIFKFWSVKVADKQAREIDALRQDIIAHSDPRRPLDERALAVVAHEDLVDQTTMRTWTTLCGFEEVCAAEIGALLEFAVAGEYKKAYDTCARLISNIKVLFTALDPVLRTESRITGAGDADGDSGDGSSGSRSSSRDREKEKEKEQGKEAKTLCRKVVSYLSLLSKTRDMSDDERVQGLTKDLLTLASAIAHYLKVLIRQGLSGAVKQQQLDPFLEAVGAYAQTKPTKAVSPFSTDRCMTCGKAVEDRCYRQRGRNDRLWHARAQCFRSTLTGQPLDPKHAAVEGGRLMEVSAEHPATAFSRVTKLEQYVILLHVALARLDLVLTNNKRPRSADGPHARHARIVEQVSASTPALASNASNNAASAAATINSTSASSAAVASASSHTTALAMRPKSGATALERTSSMLKEKAGLTLDDIRRIVASEQARLSELPKQVPQQHRRHSTEPPRHFGTLSDAEYAWVRHIAQAMLTPLAQKYLKKDVDIVSASVPPKGAASTKPTAANIWGRMGKVFAPKDAEGRVFGQPLDRLVARHGVDSSLVGLDAGLAEPHAAYALRIPSFVEDCLTAMRQKDMSVEGVFRKNGNIRRLREFVEKIDRNPEESGLVVDESPIQLAALLKKFLRDLPDPLLCARLGELWALVARVALAEQIRLIQLLVCVLPKPNRSLAEVLLSFLNWVASFAHVDDESGSKMDIANLATVLAPTLMLSSEEATGGAAVAAAAAAAAGSANSLASTVAAKNLEGTGSAGAPQSTFKNVSEPLKLMIGDCGVVAEVPDDVVRVLAHMKGPPRKLALSEIQEFLAK